MAYACYICYFFHFGKHSEPLLPSEKNIRAGNRRCPANVE